MILILISIIILVVLVKIKIKHKFWDNQTVMRKYYNKIQKIGINPKFKYNNLNDFKIITKDFSNFEKTYQFLKKNFSNDYNIDYQYFKQRYNNKNNLNISFWKSDTLVGFISSDKIKTRFENSDLELEYVDYLCVDKKFRNKNIATILISSVLNYCKADQSFLFKKDYLRLPYQHIFRSNYYFKEVMQKSNSQSLFKISRIKKNIEIKKNYFNRFLTNFKFTIFLDKESIDKFKNNNYFIYEIDNTPGKTYILGKINDYIYNKKIQKIFEIDYIMGNLNNPVKIYESFNSELSKNNVIGSNIINMGCHGGFIESNNYMKGSKVYYYTYNLGFPKIKRKDFLFNIG